MNKSNVTGFKLTNGAELVAKVVSEDDTGLVLEDAYFLHPVQKPDGLFDVQFAPVTLLGKPQNKNHMGFDFKIPRISVLFSYELNPGIVDMYLKAVSPIDLSFAPSLK